MQTISLRKISFTITIIIGLLCFNKARATIIYVDSAAAGLNNGSSWTDAYTDFQAGINAANAGDTVWVAKGTYYPTIDTSFSMKDGVAIYGGFAGTETNFSQRNLNLGDSSILKGNGYRVITNSNLHNTALLDGFTITGGSITGVTGVGFTNGGNAYGGGMYNFNSSPTLSNLIFSNNLVTGGFGGSASDGGNGNGGGMYDSNSSPILTNVTFKNNTALGGSTFADGGGNGNGGGIYNANSSPVLNTVTFSFNLANGGRASLGGANQDAGLGGGMFNSNSSPQLTNVSFYADSAKGATGHTFAYGSAFGGGMYNTNSSPILDTVYFYNNGALGGSSGMTDAGDPAYGGGMYNNASPASLTNVIFSGNTAQAGDGGYGSAIGGGMYNTACSPTLINVQFLNNIARAGFADISSAEADGGGMYNNSSSPNLINVTFSGNLAYGSDGAFGSGFGGGMYNTGSSPILMNVAFSNNLASGGLIPGAGNGSSSGYGGGIYNTGSLPKLMNVTFFKNKATGLANSKGGAIYNQSSSAIIANCVFWGDTAKTGGNDIYNTSSTPIVTYCYTQSSIAGAGNIQGLSNPFADSAHPAGADSVFMTLDDGLHILPTSAAFNSGRNDSIPAGITTDITDTTTRILDSIVEMGAYETKLSAAPVITSFAPTSVCGNDTVVVSGHNFAGNPSISFGGTPVSFSTVVNDSTIKAIAGNGSSGNIIITTSGGTATIGGFVYATPLASSVSIAINTADTICAGTSVTFTATSTNGSTPSYQWKLNGANVGNNSATYNNDSLSNNYTVYCTMTNTTGCVAPITAISDSIIIKVNPVDTASISIVASADTICSGSTVTFTATANHSGTHPSYQWRINSSNAGTDSSGFTSNALSDKDTIRCIVTGNAVCSIGLTDTSNDIIITVNTAVTPSVTISADTNNICYGTPVIFTATAINGGSAPSYQWKINGNNTGADDPVYTVNNPQDGDVISCLLTSNIGCANTPVSNNNITMAVYPLPSVTSGTDTISLGSNIVLNLSTTGSIAHYAWTPADSLSNDTTANPTAHPRINTDYVLQVTTVNGCSASGEMMVSVLPTVLSIPNAFTPNGDGYNDTWHVYDIGGSITSVDVYVYAINGGLVYQATNYQNNWDGTYDGKPLPVGTYFYYMILYYPDHTSTITGSITIIR